MGKTKYRMTKVAKALIIQLIICSIGIICGFTWEIHNENAKWDSLYYPGVQIANLDLSGRTKDEGERLLKSEYLDRLNDYSINIKGSDKVFVLEYSDLIKSIDIDKALDKAFEAGKSLDFRSKFLLLKQGILDDFKIEITLNKDYLKEFIADIETEVKKEPINAAIEKSPDGIIHIINDVKGLKVQKDKLEEYIRDAVSKKPFQICDIELPVEEIIAPITSDMLSTIDTKIASHSTCFVSSPIGRSRNVELAAKAIDNKIIAPNEVFSFNDIVGERTKEKGYMVAPVLEDGDYKSGLGGGICQVSSTLYNVVLKSGINPIERKNHSLPAAYVDLGLDATVSWGTIDFKFKNTLDYPIFIESYTKNKVLYINFYSNSDLTKREYIIRSDVYDKIPPKVQIIEDDNLQISETEVVREGFDGYWVKTVRNTYEDGELIDSEIISDDYYLPVNGIIKKGTRIDEEE